MHITISSQKNRKMKNVMIIGMLFASMSVFAQNSPKSDEAKKENLPVCCKSDKMKKAPARPVSDKEISVRDVNGKKSNAPSVQRKKVEHKGRVAVPGSPVSGKVEEKM